MFVSSERQRVPDSDVLLSGQSRCQTSSLLTVVLDMGHQLVGAAFRDDVSGLAFTLAALGGNTQLHLDVIKAQTGACATFNRFVIDATANANNHDALNLR